jgi:hypothetical protein
MGRYGGGVNRLRLETGVIDLLGNCQGALAEFFRRQLLQWVAMGLNLDPLYGTPKHIGKHQGFQLRRQQSCQKTAAEVFLILLLATLGSAGENAPGKLPLLSGKSVRVE